MATNPYENTHTIPWMSQHQLSSNRDTDAGRTARWGQQQQQFYGGYSGLQETDMEFLAVQQQPFPTDYTDSQCVNKPGAASQQKQVRKTASQKLQQAARMPKARTLALVHSFKRWIIAASLVTFGLFSGVIAYHQLQTATTSQTPSDPTHTTSPSSSSSSSQNDNNNFLDQQGANNLGTNNNQSGESTSGSNNSSQQPADNSSNNNANTQKQPVGGSHTS